MARRARDRDTGGTRAGGTRVGDKPDGGGRAGGATVSLAEAAAMLGVEEDVLLLALGDHGLTSPEARGSRLLVAELESFRAQLRTDSERARSELAALRDELEE